MLHNSIFSSSFGVLLQWKDGPEGGYGGDFRGFYVEAESGHVERGKCRRFALPPQSILVTGCFGRGRKAGRRLDGWILGFLDIWLNGGWKRNRWTHPLSVDGPERSRGLR